MSLLLRSPEIEEKNRDDRGEEFFFKQIESRQPTGEWQPDFFFFSFVSHVDTTTSKARQIEPSRIN